MCNTKFGILSIPRYLYLHVSYNELKCNQIAFMLTCWTTIFLTCYSYIARWKGKWAIKDCGVTFTSYNVHPLFICCINIFFGWGLLGEILDTVHIFVRVVEATFLLRSLPFVKSNVILNGCAKKISCICHWILSVSVVLCRLKSSDGFLWTW